MLFGFNALEDNNDHNTAFGHESLKENTTGTENVAVGECWKQTQPQIITLLLVIKQW